MFLSAFHAGSGFGSLSPALESGPAPTASPDQFYLGAHMDVKEIVERFWFRPNAEIGFGSGLTCSRLNGEFVYDIPLKSSTRWVPYVGVGRHC
jgi:hypothetical protein